MVPDSSPTPPPRHWSHRGFRIAAWSAGLLLGVPLGLVLIAMAAILIAANTGWGRHVIERRTASLTDGAVTLEGVSGRFPDALRIGHIALNDRQGTWLAIDGLVLDWRPAALVLGRARVDRISMDRLSIPRLQAGTTTSSSSTDLSGGLDLGVDIRAIHIARIEVGADIAGVAASFALDGQARLAHIAPVLNGVSVATLPVARIDLRLRRLDQDGALALRTDILPGRLGLHLTADEGPGGFATVAGLGPLDPLHLSLDLDGPRDANRLAFTLKSGDLSSNINGIIDFIHVKTQLAVSAHAPHMTVRDGVGWQGIALDAHLSGDVHHPFGQGQLTLDQPAAAGVAASRITVAFDGHEATGGQPALSRLHATIAELSIPGVRPTLFAAAPLTLDLALHPDDAGWPLDVDLAHPLLHLAGRVMTATPAQGTFDLTVSQLGPLASAVPVALDGQAGLHGSFAMPARPDGDITLALDGDVGISGGLRQAVDLVGPDGKLALRAAVRRAHGATPRVMRIDRLSLDGQAVHLALTGSQTAAPPGLRTGIQPGGAARMAAGTVDATLHLAVDDLRRALPSLRGQAAVNLAVAGAMDDMTATAHLQGQLGTAETPVGPIMLDTVFHHLPATPQGTVLAQGSLDGAPLSVAADLEQDAQGLRTLDLAHLDWKSASGKGHLVLTPGHIVPLGTLDVQMTRLADLSRLVGQDLSGSLVASVRTSDDGTAHAGAPEAARDGVPPTVTVHVDGTLASARASLRRLTLAGTVADPLGAARADMALQLDGLSVQGAAGNARVTARGSRDALAIAATSSFQNLAGAPAALSTDMVLNLPGQSVALHTLQANARGEFIRLLAPARIGFGKASGVDRLRAILAPPGVAPAQIDIAGTVKPALALTATIDNLTPAIARPFMPSLRASGTMSVHGVLRGTLASPQGTVTVAARDMTYNTDFSGGLPPASLDATAQLSGAQARLDATARAGTMIDLAVRGTVPTGGAGAMTLQTSGHVNLAAANAYLGAQGRQVQGVVQLALALGGRFSAPQATGTVTLAGGQVHDYAQGVQLSNVQGLIVAHDDRLTIDTLSAVAGPGKITVNGTLGAFQPGLPIDLHITANHARPLSSDLVTAEINTDMTIRGMLASRIDAAGKVVIPHAEINIPSSLPPSIAQLDVIRPGEDTQAQQNTSAGPVIGLDVTVSSPGEMFVRGHGLNAEMQGRLHIGGTADVPVITGGFDLRRGNFNLAGISLDFTKGRVAFNGSGVTQAVDPTLDFEAERATNAGTARLVVGGYASAPKITFSSQPPLSQDQIMAMLLFGTDAQSLSPTQMAEIAGAVATLTGGSGFDPLATVRNTLGLDRLQLGSGSGVGKGTGTSVEAGKYVMRGVYVGAKQATSGSGTQAQVQVDLTRRLKLNTTVGTGGNVTGFTTPENDPGSSVGLSYQYQY
jgi:translocation and assembly module TamB